MMNPYGTAGQVMYPGYMVRLPLSRLQGDPRTPPQKAVSARFARPPRPHERNGARRDDFYARDFSRTVSPANAV
jgi:hypothetical protein